jgi:hypothetical protein
MNAAAVRLHLCKSCIDGVNILQFLWGSKLKLLARWPSCCLFNRWFRSHFFDIFFPRGSFSGSFFCHDDGSFQGSNGSRNKCINVCSIGLKESNQEVSQNTNVHRLQWVCSRVLGTLENLERSHASSDHPWVQRACGA